MTNQEQLQQIRERLAQLDPNNRDHLGEISNLKTKEAELLATVDHEERVQKAAQDTAYWLETMNINGLTLESMVPNEDDRLLLKLAVQGKLNDQAEEMSAEIKRVTSAADDRETQLKRQNEHLQQLVAQTEVDNANLRRELAEAKAQAEEAKASRDNAAAQLAEANAEIERLKAASQPKKVDWNQEIQDAAAKALASRTKVFNIRWADNLRKTHYLAERADTGETITIPYLEKGKYLEVSSEEAARFRNEAQTEPDHEPVALDDLPELKEPEAPVVTFPEVHDTVQSSAAVDQSAGQADSGTISREEFTALVGRVERLEAKANLMGAA